jgi:hypothetical protein
MVVAGMLSFAPRDFFEVEAPTGRPVPQVAF